MKRSILYFQIAPRNPPIAEKIPNESRSPIYTGLSLQFEPRQSPTTTRDVTKAKINPA